MRKLNTQDVFKLARLIKRANLHETIVPLFQKGQQLNTENDKESKDKKKEELGVEAVFAIIDKVSGEEMENELYSFLAGIAEKTPDEIKNLTLEALAETFAQIASENNVVNFFKVAFQSAKK